MDKLKMAHDWAMKYGSPENFKLTVDEAWEYADAMQAEADKRNIEAKNTDISEFQIDWSQAPKWAKWWAVDQDNNGSGWFYEKQPTMGECSWFVGRDDKIRKKYNDSYTGNWKDSLHKRPDSK